VSIPETFPPADGSEPPELIPRNFRTGSRLAVGATTFVFFVPFFAYFYLRSLNSSGMWRPAGVHPPAGFGIAIMACFAASGVLLLLAAARVTRRAWWALAGCSFSLGVLGIAMQIIEWTRLGFGPSAGGYASVFIGWTLLTTVFAIATMLSLETQLAHGLRYPDASLSVVRPRLAALTYYWAYVAALSVAMWIVLYTL
jgi:heme/copper-type cytochrome/quinol oxidase subunit 3